MRFLVLVLLLSLAGASRRWSGEESWEDEEEPSAGFWIVVGVAGAVAIVLIAMIIWYFCCPRQSAVTGTQAGGAYSAVLQPVSSAALFSPSGVPITTGSKRE